MGTSVEQRDKVYGHLLADSLSRISGGRSVALIVTTLRRRRIGYARS